MFRAKNYAAIIEEKRIKSEERKERTVYFVRKQTVSTKHLLLVWEYGSSW
jgi:hypothetical protein